MNKVFIVTSGWYENTDIEMVFSNQDAADRFAKTITPPDEPGAFVSVDEYEVRSCW